MRGRVGDFVLPANPRVAARALLAYNALRPARIRTVRALTAAALVLGAHRVLTRTEPLGTAADGSTLLDHLRDVLACGPLVFAATDHGGTGFRTPVLQLFDARGRPVGYAKIGWDPVTRALVDAEADALARAASAGWVRLTAPALRWHGTWRDLSVLVTAPMPRSVRRLPARALPPVTALTEVATLFGPPSVRAVGTSAYVAGLRAIADAAEAAGRPVLASRLATTLERFADTALTFGAWHGDWVEWNLGTTDGRVVAWDWAHAAPDVPFGFDLLQFFHLRHHNLHGVPTDAALARARDDADCGLVTLGLDAEARAATGALHALEVAARTERARQDRGVLVGVGR
jgi:hypothetical protein